MSKPWRERLIALTPGVLPGTLTCFRRRGRLPRESVAVSTPAFPVRYVGGAAVNDESDDRSPFAEAAEWTSHVTTVAAEMALPSLGGYWIDQRLGTKAVFLVLGALFGLALGIWHLLRLTKTASKKKG